MIRKEEDTHFYFSLLFAYFQFFTKFTLKNLEYPHDAPQSYLDLTWDYALLPLYISLRSSRISVW